MNVCPPFHLTFHLWKHHMHLSEILQRQYTVESTFKVVMLSEHQACCIEFYLATLIGLYISLINIHLT